MPPIEERTLIQMSPVPNWHGIEPRKSSRRYADIRGPELINNDLIYGQFGIMVFDFNFFFFKELIQISITLIIISRLFPVFI